MTKLLDCTIRDGGYVNNWEFTDEEVKELYKSTSLAGFDFFEIGFRTKLTNLGKGKWFYCNEEDITDVKNYYKNGCKISVMTRIEDINLDLNSFKNKKESNIDMVRVFLTYENENVSGYSIQKLEKCRDVLIHLNNLNYITCLNLGSTSVIKEEDLNNVFKIVISNTNINFLYFADSYGSLLFNNFDKYINNLSKLLKIYNKPNIKLGFHAHNNLGNAYSNFIRCLSLNVDIIDSTVSGLGRGSGNLHSEISILHLYKDTNNKKYDIRPLLDYSDKYIISIKEFNGKYNFGYNNILMICGMYNIHPNYGIELLNYNLDPSILYDYIIKINEHNIKNFNYNYDKTLLSKLITKKSAKIKIIFMDFDGTLSDGKVYIDKNGEEIKTSNSKDGYIIKKLKEKYIFGIISGSNLDFFKERASYLGIKYIIDNVPINKSKLIIIQELLNNLNLDSSNLAYIGDDLNDMELISNSLSGCPKNAHYKIQKKSKYICKKNGGEGCVREFIEFIEDKS